MKQLTEAELKALMLLSLDGDEVAYRCLLDMLRHLLTGYYARRISHFAVTDVDDLVQDTLLSLHQRRITSRSGKNGFQPFLDCPAARVS